MLKIKDNVDLKELEKFGFKPKYDEDTGKLDRYNKVFKNNNYRFWIKIEMQTKYIEVDYNWCGFDIELINDLISVIYDLIQAGLVEKVGD